MLTQSIELNLDYMNARRLLLPSAGTVHLVMVGCGGTGSWLAPHLVRIVRLYIDRFGKQARIYFIDPDRVEEKNCYRQNFAPAEIGRNKAEALAFRYGLAWGLEIEAVAARAQQTSISHYDRDDLYIYIGCVDNADARKSIYQAAQSWAYNNRAWWLDCGNHKSAGQVVLGSACQSPRDPYELPGMCTWLPSPAARHPDLLEAQTEERPDINLMSCADMAIADSQGMAINATVANHAANYLSRLLLTRDLLTWGTYIDLESGITRSKYIVPEPESCATP